MKSTGIVRHMDPLGRIVIPIELRRILGIGARDPLEIFVEGDRVILQKYSRGCLLCDSTQNLFMTELGKVVCKECVTSFSKAQQLNASSMKAYMDERN